MTTYKPSIFNNYAQASNGDLLMFNSYIGPDSFCRVSKTISDQLFQCLKQEKVTRDDFAHEDTFNDLIWKGYLVSSDEDELLKIENRYIKIIANQAGSNMLCLIILPTEQCNFRCTYCYEDFSKPAMSEEVQNAVYLFVRRNIQKYSALRVGWFGGEPMVAMKIIESLSDRFITLCKTLKKGYSAHITTNGYFLDKNNFEKLLSRNVLAYQITIDGTKDIHDKYRHTADGKGTFDKILKNLLYIKNNVKSHTFHISIRTNFTSESLEKLDDYIKLLNDSFKDDKRFSLFIRVASNQGGNNKIHEIEDELLNSTQVSSIAKSIKNKLPDNSVNVDQHIHMIAPGGSMCYAATNNHYVIDPYGNLRKCTHFLDDKFNCIGKIEPNGQHHIDEGLEARWVGKMILNEKCKKCSFLGACFNRVCPYNRFNNQNDDTAYCPYEKEDLEDIMAIAADTSYRDRFYNIYSM